MAQEKTKDDDKEKHGRVRHNEKKRMSYAEKQEFKSLEKEIQVLEEEKKELEQALCSGDLSVEELTTKSKRFSEIDDLIDEKSMRWLELSELEE